MALKITVEPISAHVQTLYLAGRLTQGGGAEALRDALKDISAPEEKLILDLAGVEYIDSTGMATLVSGFIAAQKLGQRIVLAGLGNRVKELLQLTKLHSIFEIYDSVDDAKAALAGS
jgi:anti-sigma B factor antagonist